MFLYQQLDLTALLQTLTWQHIQGTAIQSKYTQVMEAYHFLRTFQESIATNGSGQPNYSSRKQS